MRLHMVRIDFNAALQGIGNANSVQSSSDSYLQVTVSIEEPEHGCDDTSSCIRETLVSCPSASLQCNRSCCMFCCHIHHPGRNLE